MTNDRTFDDYTTFEVIQRGYAQAAPPTEDEIDDVEDPIRDHLHAIDWTDSRTGFTTALTAVKSQIRLLEVYNQAVPWGKIIRWMTKACNHVPSTCDPRNHLAKAREDVLTKFPLLVTTYADLDRSSYQEAKDIILPADNLRKGLIKNGVVAAGPMGVASAIASQATAGSPCNNF